MTKFKIKDMTRGWFVGNFEPSAFKTDNCEVSYKSYKAGEYEAKHYHGVATEISLVTSGKIMMNGVTYGKGDIIIMNPGEATDFKALTDATNVVVKVPCVKGDKYLS